MLSDWQYVKSIQLPVIADAQYVKLALDSDVSAVGDFSDIRIVGAGQETPYQLLSQDFAPQSPFSSRVINNSSDVSGRTSFVLDSGSSGTIHNHVLIDTLSANYRRQVSVYASDNLLEGDSSWKLLTNKGYIYKFTDERAALTVIGNAVAYPQNSSRYIKVVISAGSEGAILVGSASVTKQEIQELLSKSVSSTGTIGSDKNNTVLTFDLGSVGVFTNEITLAAIDPNFSRRVVIESSNDAVNWDYVAQGYISHLQTPLFAGGSLSISYPERKARYVKATVFNDNDQPLSFSNTAQFTSPIRSLVFKANPGISYSLYYGNPSATAPRYDLSRIFQYLETNSFAQASLGGQSLNTKYVPPPPPTVPFTESHKYLLNTLLVLLVILSGVMVYFYLRKTVVKQDGSIDGPEKPSNFVKG